MMLSLSLIRTKRRISAIAAIENVITMIVQAAAMDLRPRRQIQIPATPIVLILLDSSTVYCASAEDTVHYREINVVHLLVVRQQQTKT